MKRIRKYIPRILDEWQPQLGLTDWTVTITLVKKPANGSETAAGVCYAQWEYKLVEIELVKKHIRNMDYKDLEEVMIHELLHAVVSPMQDQNTDEKHKELVVTNLTNAFLWTRKRVGVKG
jgi:hypothetical protein